MTMRLQIVSVFYIASRTLFHFFLIPLHISKKTIMKRHKINWRVPKGAELTELDKKVLFYQDKRAFGSDSPVD